MRGRHRGGGCFLTLGKRYQEQPHCCVAAVLSEPSHHVQNTEKAARRHLQGDCLHPPARGLSAGPGRPGGQTVSHVGAGPSHLPRAHPGKARLRAQRLRRVSVSWDLTADRVRSLRGRGEVWRSPGTPGRTTVAGGGPRALHQGGDPHRVEASADPCFRALWVLGQQERGSKTLHTFPCTLRAGAGGTIPAKGTSLSCQNFRQERWAGVRWIPGRPSWTAQSGPLGRQRPSALSRARPARWGLSHGDRGSMVGPGLALGQGEAKGRGVAVAQAESQGWAVGAGHTCH